jgi:hypothetical protein
MVACILVSLKVYQVKQHTVEENGLIADPGLLPLKASIKRLWILLGKL